MDTRFDIDRLRDGGLLRTQLFVDGEWRDGEGEPFDVVDPASGAVVATLASASAADVEAAVAAAARAGRAWAAVTAPERARVMRRWFELIVENADDSR